MCVYRIDKFLFQDADRFARLVTLLIVAALFISSIKNGMQSAVVFSMIKEYPAIKPDFLIASAIFCQISVILSIFSNNRIIDIVGNISIAIIGIVLFICGTSLINSSDAISFSSVFLMAWGCLCAILANHRTQY